MVMNESERRLATAFVELADTLSGDPDLPDLLQTLVDRVAAMLGASAVGLFLDDQRGGLQLCASSTHAVAVHTLLAVATNEGPCLETFHTGQAMLGLDRDEHRGQWPLFSAALSRAGLYAGYVLPLRTRSHLLGSMGLFFTRPVELSEDDRAVVEALTKVATLGFLQEGSQRHREIVATQLQAALRVRVLVEQAKGVVAEVLDISVDQAFDRLKQHARQTRTPLGALAAQVVDHTIEAADLSREARLA